MTNASAIAKAPINRPASRLASASPRIIASRHRRFLASHAEVRLDEAPMDRNGKGRRVNAGRRTA
jgi:hypothetical protein